MDEQRTDQPPHSSRAYPVRGGLLTWFWLLRLRMRGMAMAGPMCRRCAYVVAGLDGHTCPECGGDLDDIGVAVPRTLSVLPLCIAVALVVFVALMLLGIPVRAAVTNAFFPPQTTPTHLLVRLHANRGDYTSSLVIRSLLPFQQAPTDDVFAEDIHLTLLGGQRSPRSLDFDLIDEDTIALRAVRDDSFIFDESADARSEFIRWWRHVELDPELPRDAAEINLLLTIIEASRTQSVAQLPAVIESADPSSTIVEHLHVKVAAPLWFRIPVHSLWTILATIGTVFAFDAMYRRMRKSTAPTALLSSPHDHHDTTSNDDRPSHDPRAARTAEKLQDLAGRGGDAHADEQPRPRGR